jgi:hypothetical protein
VALVIEKRGPEGLIVRDDDAVIAEFAGLELGNVRLRPGGSQLFSSEVPIPLYWRQYANYQNPDRNASGEPRLEVLPAGSDDRVLVECAGRNSSGSISSRATVEFVRMQEPVRYEIGVRTTLRVQKGASWRVVPNPHHGELEFLTLFPSVTFLPGREGSKRYQACYLDQNGMVWRIPHHHLESVDKHNIGMHKHDRFLWLLEDENPCLEILSDDPVTAGLCAYMWDGHFAFKVCTRGEPVDLPGSSRFEASYRLSSVGREAGAKLVEAARERDAPNINEIPICTAGVNRFDTTWNDLPEGATVVWPWEHEIDSAGDTVECSLDRIMGYDDSSSLRIVGRGGARARWIATTFGPAFGGAPFNDHCRFRLEAVVRTRQLAGRATVSIRLHRSGRGDVFDVSTYDHFSGATQASGDTDWVRLSVETPPISPPPDRLHLLLEHEGSGTSWFDNVLLEER